MEGKFNFDLTNYMVMAIIRKYGPRHLIHIDGFPIPELSAKEIYSRLMKLCFVGNGRFSREETIKLFRKLNGTEWGSDTGIEKYSPFVFPTPIASRYGLIKGVEVFNPYAFDLSYLELISDRPNLPVGKELFPLLEEMYKDSKDFCSIVNSHELLKSTPNPLILEDALLYHLDNFKTNHRIDLSTCYGHFREFLVDPAGDYHIDRFFLGLEAEQVGNMDRLCFKVFEDDSRHPFVPSDVSLAWRSLTGLPVSSYDPVKTCFSDPELVLEFYACCDLHTKVGLKELCRKYMDEQKDLMFKKASVHGIEFVPEEIFSRTQNAVADDVDFTVALVLYDYDVSHNYVPCNQKEVDSLIRVGGDSVIEIHLNRGIDGDKAAEEFLSVLPEEYLNGEPFGLNYFCVGSSYVDSRQCSDFNRKFFKKIEDVGCRLSSVRISPKSGIEFELIENKLRDNIPLLKKCKMIVDDSNSSDKLKELGICRKSVVSTKHSMHNKQEQKKVQKGSMKL